MWQLESKCAELPMTCSRPADQRAVSNTFAILGKGLGAFRQLFGYNSSEAQRFSHDAGAARLHLF
jgi:hypothetical protein